MWNAGSEDAEPEGYAGRYTERRLVYEIGGSMVYDIDGRIGLVCVQPEQVIYKKETGEIPKVLQRVVRRKRSGT